MKIALRLTLFWQMLLGLSLWLCQGYDKFLMEPVYDPMLSVVEENVARGRYGTAKAREKALSVAKILLPSDTTVNMCVSMKFATWICGIETTRHASCVNLPNNDFKCTCPEGFTGRMCENDIDECIGRDGKGNLVSHKCTNGGTCNNIVFQENKMYTSDGYKCLCPPGYAGKYCQIQMKEKEQYNCATAKLFSFSRLNSISFAMVGYYDLGTSEVTSTDDEEVQQAFNDARASASSGNYDFDSELAERLRGDAYPLFPADGIEVQERDNLYITSTQNWDKSNRPENVKIGDERGFVFEYNTIRGNNLYYRPMIEIRFEKGILIRTFWIKPGIESTVLELWPEQILTKYYNYTGRMVTKFKFQYLDKDNKWTWYTNDGGKHEVLSVLNNNEVKLMSENYIISPDKSYKVTLPKQIVAAGVRVVAEDWFPKNKGLDPNSKCYMSADNLNVPECQPRQSPNQQGAVQLPDQQKGANTISPGFVPVLSEKSFDPILRLAVGGCYD